MDVVLLDTVYSEFKFLRPFNTFSDAVMNFNGDTKLLLSCIGGSLVAIQLFRAGKWLYDNKIAGAEWVPVGTVKNLWLFPIKSCHRKEVFSVYCGPLGTSFGEVSDRQFLAIDGETGKFHSARTVPKLAMIRSDIIDGSLHVWTPNGEKAQVSLDDVIARKVVHRATLFIQLQTDGLDCGDDIADLFVRFTGVPGIRIIMWRPDLFNGRYSFTMSEWWNNPVPKRTDTIMFVDLSPYMVTTEASLNDLNSRLDKKVSSTNFRANIVVDHCEAWDEDKWAEIRIGDAQLQCFKPCTRCVLSTVDPERGEKDPDMQPLKKLREFRLAPEGKLRNSHKDSPIFGVNAALLHPGYIHVGQTVYARYKPSAF